MSEWVRATREAKADFKEMEKAVAGYSYKDPKKAESTDEHVKRILADEAHKAKDFLFPIIEAAYLEEEFDNTGALEDVMQWLDVFMLELGLPLEWDDRASSKNFVRLIKADVTLLRNVRKLAKILEQLNEKVLHGHGGSMVRKSAELKKFISDLLVLFKRRRHALGG
jgi:hypothetical protein